MDHQAKIEQYLAGPGLLRQAVEGMSDEQLDAKPIAGQWSTRQVVCHLVDFEPIYADRIKRVIAEDRPTLFGGDPDLFAARLAYERRSVPNELDLMTAVRTQLATILHTLEAKDFQRIGNHSTDGPLTLETLLDRITRHVPHHIRFIEAKRQILDRS